MKQRIPAPTRIIDGKKFRLHCTRLVAPSTLEQRKLQRTGYRTYLEHEHGVYTLWKEVKRE